MEISDIQRFAFTGRPEQLLLPRARKQHLWDPHLSCARVEAARGEMIRVPPTHFAGLPQDVHGIPTLLRAIVKVHVRSLVHLNGLTHDVLCFGYDLRGGEEPHFSRHGVEVHHF